MIEGRFQNVKHCILNGICVQNLYVNVLEIAILEITALFSMTLIIFENSLTALRQCFVRAFLVQREFTLIRWPLPLRGSKVT